MKTAAMAVLFAAILPSPVLSGEIYGTIKEGGKSIKQGVKVEVRCPKGSYPAETDKFGAYRVFVPENAKCALTVRHAQGTPSLDVQVFEDSARYNLVLEQKDGKVTLRSE